MVLAPPERVQLWLAYRPIEVIVVDTMALPMGVGVLIGAVGGCASGVYQRPPVRLHFVPCSGVMNAFVLRTSARVLQPSLSASIQCLKLVR